MTPLDVRFIESPGTDGLKFTEPLREREGPISRESILNRNLGVRALDFRSARPVLREFGQHRFNFPPHVVRGAAGTNVYEDLKKTRVARAPIPGRHIECEPGIDQGARKAARAATRQNARQHVERVAGVLLGTGQGGTPGREIGCG
jgi:hypothetical protein